MKVKASTVITRYNGKPVMIDQEVLLNEAGQPLLINGPEDSPSWMTLSREGISSFLGLPILSKGKALGVISYYSYSPTLAFDMEVVNLMQTVSSQLANMIENHQRGAH